MKRIAWFLIFMLPFSGKAAAGDSDRAEKLASSDEEVRSDACLALAEEGPGAVGQLAPMLRDKSMLVRHSAAYALSRIGGARVEGVFREGLGSSSYDVRRVCALGLGMMKGQDVAAALGPLLKDDNWEVRWAAAYALGRGGDRRALALLGPVAGSDPYRDRASGNCPVREAARAAIARLNAIVGWETDLDRALGRARAEQRPLLLYFRKSGSPLCRQFEDKVFREEKIVDAAQRCVCVWLDHLSAPEPFGRYSIARVPFIVLLDPAGSVAGKVEGSVSPEDLLGQLLTAIEPDRNAGRLQSRLEHSPRDWEASWQLAELFMDEGVWEKARAKIGPIIAGDPYNVSSLLDNALFARAYIAGRLGDYATSFKEFNELLECFAAFGDRAQALYCLGVSALKIGQNEEAKKALEKLIREYPGTELASAAGKILGPAP